MGPKKASTKAATAKAPSKAGAAKAAPKAKAKAGGFMSTVLKQIADKEDADKEQADKNKEQGEDDMSVLKLMPASSEGAPAASQDDDHVPAAQADPPEEEEDYEDGKPDPRPCSRAQAYVFKKYFTELDKEVQQEWLTLQRPGGATGKQARKNEIVNASVPRNASFKGKIEVKRMTLSKVVQLTDTNEKTIEEVHLETRKKAFKLTTMARR